MHLIAIEIVYYKVLAVYRVWGGGALHQIFNSGCPTCDEKLTQSDLRFCKNKSSKISKNNVKGTRLDRKSRKQMQ